MTIDELRKYAELLGVQWVFDGHEFAVLVMHTADGRKTWRGVQPWNREYLLIERARKWLDSLPWPGDDDPRTGYEGVYIPS